MPRRICLHTVAGVIHDARFDALHGLSHRTRPYWQPGAIGYNDAAGFGLEVRVVHLAAQNPARPLERGGFEPFADAEDVLQP